MEKNINIEKCKILAILQIKNQPLLKEHHSQ
jgi:hypothetical protein